MVRRSTLVMDWRRAHTCVYARVVCGSSGLNSSLQYRELQMADHLVVLKQKTRYNLRKLFSEIHHLKTFGVQHRLGWWVKFKAHTSLTDTRVKTNRRTDYCNPSLHAPSINQDRRKGFKDSEGVKVMQGMGKFPSYNYASKCPFAFNTYMHVYTKIVHNIQCTCMKCSTLNVRGVLCSHALHVCAVPVTHIILVWFLNNAHTCGKPRSLHLYTPQEQQ